MAKGKLDRDAAIDYLREKGKISDEDDEFTKDEEKIIQKVMKEGRIFDKKGDIKGDPVVFLD